MTTLSIIIPVYCVEKSLDRCLQSIVQQSFTDWEAILVDDGSPDRCPAICDAWAKRDSRITVIHKANGGLSDARNTGIDIAKGDYITFVDSDDFIAPDTYLPLMQQLAKRPEIDILEYSLICQYGSPQEKKIVFGNCAYTDLRTYWLDGQAYQHSYACNKLFRRSLFDEVRFPKGTVFEDLHTLPLLLEHARLTVTTSLGLYYYCANSEGITHRASGPELKMLLQGHIIMYDKLNLQHSATEEAYYMHILNIQLSTSLLTGEPPQLPDRKISHPLQLESNSAKIKAISLNLLGINNLCRIYRILFRMKKPR